MSQVDTPPKGYDIPPSGDMVNLPKGVCVDIKDLVAMGLVKKETKAPGRAPIDHKGLADTLVKEGSIFFGKGGVIARTPEEVKTLEGYSAENSTIVGAIKKVLTSRGKSFTVVWFNDGTGKNWRCLLTLDTPAK